MAKVYSELNERLQQFILRQHMFFVGSAPLAAQGHVNISPKGIEGLRILDPKTVAYLDLTGSGIESIAHLKENGRFVMMFCSFDDQPSILRLHGEGTVIERTDPEWKRLIGHFADTKMARAIIKLKIHRVSDSCGWGVPKYQFLGTREQYDKYAEQLDDDGLRQAQQRSNMRSIDGLAGLKRTSL